MKIEDYIKLEQAKAIHKNIGLVITGMVGVTVITSVMFWTEASPLILTLWIASALIIIGIRLAIGRKFNPQSNDAANANEWLHMSVAGSILTGFHWAVVPILFLTQDATLNTLFVSIIFAGHLAASMSSNSAYPPSYFALAIPTTTLFAGLFFSYGGLFYNSVAVMICLYAMLVTFMSKNAAALFRQARELNFKNMTLMRELKKQKDAAELATLSKNRFLAAASHDLRQPLHSTGLLLSALEQYVPSKEGKALLEDIYQGNDALNHSFSSLLDVSKLDAGVVQPEKIHVMLDSLIMPTLNKYRLEATQKGLTFEFEGEPLAIYSDPTLLGRILNNLISNALKYTNEGTVRISWSVSANGWVRILIKDTGIGIDAHQLSEIFSEYYQVNNPERDREKGFGLGLAIVRRLCEILSVRLYVCSEPGTSTTFSVYVQIGDPSKITALKQTESILTSLSSMNFLIIDDDASVRRSMHRLITSWDGVALIADSEQDALERVINSGESIDLIIADYRLRGSNTGIEAIRRICEEVNQDIPAIIVTGDTSPDRLQAINDAGFTVLHKPVSAASLRSAIQQKIKKAEIAKVV